MVSMVPHLNRTQDTIPYYNVQVAWQTDTWINCPGFFYAWGGLRQHWHHLQCCCRINCLNLLQHLSWSIIARKQKLTKRFQEQENRIAVVELIWDPQLISTTDFINHYYQPTNFTRKAVNMILSPHIFAYQEKLNCLICSFTVRSPSIALWYFPASLSASVASSCLHFTQMCSCLTHNLHH